MHGGLERFPFENERAGTGGGEVVGCPFEPGQR
jgi:hypothetical protein